MHVRKQTLTDLVDYAEVQQFDVAPLLLLLAWSEAAAEPDGPAEEGTKDAPPPDHYYPH